MEFLATLNVFLGATKWINNRNVQKGRA